MMTGLEQIALERFHQILNNGYTAEHDANRYKHSCELLDAAITFIRHDYDGKMQLYPLWASIRAQKTSEGNETPVMQRIMRLRIAGALIAAEIDRLQAISDVPSI